MRDKRREREREKVRETERGEEMPNPDADEKHLSLTKSYLVPQP